jgi:hypothetical protein
LSSYPPNQEAESPLDKTLGEELAPTVKNTHPDDWVGMSEDEIAGTIDGIVLNPDDEKTDPATGRTAYWDDEEGIMVIDNPNDPLGGTAFKPDEKDYFNRWPEVGR